MFSVTFLMPFYLSEVLGYGSQKIGMTLVAVPLAVAVIAPFSGSLSDKIGSRIPASLGLAVSAVGLLLIGHLGMNPGQAHIIGALLVVGIGSAVFQTPNSSAIMGAVPQERRGVAAGVLATMRNLGMVIGISVSGAVYTSYKAYYIAQLGVLAGSVHAFRNAFLVAAVICAVGVITAAARGSAVPETASEARIGN
jgi:MFS family permease